MIRKSRRRGKPRLPPDLLGTWWECVLAIMAIGFVVWLIDDIARYGL